MRDVICVDIETTGLSPSSVPLEVAAVNLATGEELAFAPYVDRAALMGASPAALRINRYFERGVWERTVGIEDTRRQYAALGDWLEGSTLAGANPTFDDARLPPSVTRGRHHRLLDLSAYAAGVLGLAPGDLPGLAKVCEMLEVQNTEPHSALGDARATAECFRRLMKVHG